jgi:hypothetical protein
VERRIKLDRERLHRQNEEALREVGKQEKARDHLNRLLEKQEEERQKNRQDRPQEPPDLKLENQDSNPPQLPLFRQKRPSAN